ncbi:MAG: Lon protease family protein [Gammaproteobacteria bacterium]|nr:Lon protease family protein [Gammaproteobacteria bacterium]
MRIAAESLQPQIFNWATQRPDTPQANALVGQNRALNALQQALSIGGRYAHGFVVTPAGMRTYDVLQQVQNEQQWVHANKFDWVYVANPESAAQPLCVNLPCGKANDFLIKLWELLQADVSVRKPLLDFILETYPGERVARYIDLVSDKTFDDLPGTELATVIVTHEEHEPFMLCDRVTEASLFGSIRLQSVEGTISSDLHLIEAGAILKANGGVLAIDAEELLLQPGLWRKLKYILKTSEFDWPQPGDANIAAYYQPEAIPVHIKVLLLGERDIYAQLRELDRDFDNLFPYLADFSSHYSLNQEPLQAYFDYLAYVEREAAVLPLASDAYPALFKFVTRITDFQTELSLDTIAIMQLLRESCAIARERHAASIAAEDISSALKQRESREGYIAELSRRAILEGQVYIETEGEVVGQINGLTVITAGGHEFGEPTRITATVHYGDGDIIDIDRKSELSGSIHTKGVMILSAYIANVFARNEAMALSATIVFEQSYHEVDGDSASLAELCCLLSALAEAPIQQGLAITGAVDQFGRVQAIGAVNEKIEGYFELCRTRGLTGKQGVIIPAANLSQLNLADDVIAAVKADKFHVFAIEHVGEALELLTQVEQKQLYAKIEQRLNELQQIEREVPWWRRWFN